jgi:hypothetical protein
MKGSSPAVSDSHKKIIRPKGLEPKSSTLNFWRGSVSQREAHKSPQPSRLRDTANKQRAYPIHFRSPTIMVVVVWNDK